MEWGVVDGVIYENWKEAKVDVESILKQPYCFKVFGLDYGYSCDATALFCGIIDTHNYKLYVYNEVYETGMSNERIASVIRQLGFENETIIADSSEPKSNDRLYTLGIRGIRRSKKGKDSINNGIDFLQDYEIIVDPKCVNFLTEISNYTWDEDKFGKKLNVPAEGFDHLMDAMRYACEPYMTTGYFSFD